MALWARIVEGVVVETLDHPSNPHSLFDLGWTWVQAPEGTLPNATYADGAFTNPVLPDQPEPTPPAAPPVTAAHVVAERARRLAGGFDFDFGSGKGIHRIGTAPADMAGWDEVTKYASALVAAGQGGATIQIVTATGPVTITAEDWQDVLVAAGDFRQPIWAASFALQAAEPIPADYADDGYWP